MSDVDGKLLVLFHSVAALSCKSQLYETKVKGRNVSFHFYVSVKVD